MPLKLSELTAERIGHWLKREAGKRSTSAAKAFRLLRAFIRWTADVPEYRGIVPADACTARAVREALPASRTKEGDCLQREQRAETRRTSPTCWSRTYAAGLYPDVGRVAAEDAGAYLVASNPGTRQRLDSWACCGPGRLARRMRCPRRETC